MPSNLERARSGLRALSVRRDLMAPSSEYPSQFAVRLMMETWKEQPKGLVASQMETQLNHVPAAPARPSFSSSFPWAGGYCLVLAHRDWHRALGSQVTSDLENVPVSWV